MPNVFRKELNKQIKVEAFNLGFALCGIIHPNLPLHYHDYIDWVYEGLGNGLAYLTGKHAIRMRQNPKNVFSKCSSIISVALPYAFDVTERKSFLIASYAHGLDYHNVIKEKLARLAKFIQSKIEDTLSFEICCDSTGILEKMLAYQAGLGWVGKNGLLINPIWGSGLLLGELMINLELPDESNPLDDQCGDCQACIQACPSQCIKDNRTIQAYLCNSFQSIENRGIILLEQRDSLRNWVFGCDICQLVCPYNHQEYSNQTYQKLGIINVIESGEWLEHGTGTISDEVISQTALNRIRTAGILRNSIIAIGNLKMEQYMGFLHKIYESNENPEMRSLSLWAIRRITKSHIRLF